MGSSFCNLTNPDHHDRVFSMVIDFDTNPQLEVQITIHDGIIKVIHRLLHKTYVYIGFMDSSLFDVDIRS